MQSAISNPYEMHQTPTRERTPIDIHVNGKRGRCINHGLVQIKTITSFHFGYLFDLKTGVEKPKSAEVCSLCNSVIQAAPQEAVKPEPGYRCFSCGAEYPAGTKFLNVVGIDQETRNLVSGKMCPRCKEPAISKLEKQA